MKASRYNYKIDHGEKVIFFNGITENVFAVSKKHAESYRMIMQHPDDNAEIYGDFIGRLKGKGFILEDDVDEAALVEKKFNSVWKPEEYHLMILPTYQCNLRCWYCVQEHSDTWITDEVERRLKLRIIKKLQDPEIKRLLLSWFGGEPTLNYNKLLELTLFARDEALKRGKQFHCSITTNGTLLNSKKIEELKEAGVTSYQITIDGTREMHDSIKKIPNKSAYDITMSNIRMIVGHTHCTLRFNYTAENLAPDSIMQDIKEKFPPELLKKMTFALHKVWQEDQHGVDTKKVERMFNLGVESGMYTKLPSTGLCYADQKHFDCIFPNGRSEKCDNESMTKSRGYIDESGEIIWEGDVSDIRTNYLREGSECRDCRYLPLCWGPCVSIRRRNLSKGLSPEKCTYADRDRSMEDCIRDRYRVLSMNRREQANIQD